MVPDLTPRNGRKPSRLAAPSVTLLLVVAGIFTLAVSCPYSLFVYLARNEQQRSAYSNYNDEYYYTSLSIRNCVKSSSGAPSGFWSNSSRLDRHMNHSGRARTVVQLMHQLGALGNGTTGRIVDIGSGLLALRDALPEEERTRYVSVDVQERVAGAGTVVCNLNRHEFPLFLDNGSEQQVSAFVFLGSFEYVLDKMTVLHLCRKHKGAHIIMNYAVAMAVKNAAFSWVAPLDSLSLLEAAEIAGYEATILMREHGKLVESTNSAAIDGNVAWIYFLPKPTVDEQ